MFLAIHGIQKSFGQGQSRIQHCTQNEHKVPALELEW